MNHTPVTHTHIEGTDGPDHERRSIFPAGDLSSRIAGRGHTFGMVSAAQRAGYRDVSFDNVQTLQVKFANLARPQNPVKITQEENYAGFSVGIRSQG